MIRTFQHLWLLLVVSSLLAVPAAKAGVFKGHPYHDRHCSIHFSPGIVVLDAPHCASPCAGTCGPAPGAGIPSGVAEFEPPFTIQGYGQPMMVAPPALRGDCPPPTNALLRVWVDDGATVWINGHKTKPQKLAGANRGSRVFSLTGLVAGEIQPALVQVAAKEDAHEKERQSKTLTVRAGQSYESRFPEVLPPPAQEAVPPVIDKAVRRAEVAAKSAKDAATHAKTAAREAGSAQGKAESAVAQARRVAEAAQADVGKKLSQMTAMLAAAQQAAKQAARTNSESFEFLGNDKSVGASLKYRAGGAFPEIDFDRTTRSTLIYIETSGALAGMDRVEIVIKYYFTIQIPHASVPGGFKDETTFEIVGRPAVFNAGAAIVDFFDPDHPEQHLSSEFKNELKKKWNPRYQGGRVKVEIRAVRPNGSQTPVAPVGNRMTIEVRQI